METIGNLLIAAALAAALLIASSTILGVTRNRTLRDRNVTVTTGLAPTITIHGYPAAEVNDILDAHHERRLQAARTIHWNNITGIPQTLTDFADSGVTIKDGGGDRTHPRGTAVKVDGRSSTVNIDSTGNRRIDTTHTDG